MSELRVDSVKSKGGGAPDLPKGVTISGITTAATLGATQIDVSNVNVSGVVTSATLSGPLLSTGTPTLGLGVTINSSGLVVSGVATAGIVSATTLYGDGSNLTGIAATIAPLFYNPDTNDQVVTVNTGIGITFNQQIKAGSGNITLRKDSASGAVVENFGVGSSVTISENTSIINPTSSLTGNSVYHISYPSGCFTNNEGESYAGTAYTFSTLTGEKKLFVWGAQCFSTSPAQETGILGLNNLVSYSSPVQLPGTTWSKLPVGADYASHVSTSAAIKTDGTLWTWGHNYQGSLGQNQQHDIKTSSPAQVGSNTTWASVSSNFGGMAAIKTDGTLWSWGYGGWVGWLGENDRVNRSSPIQVPGFSGASTGDGKISVGNRNWMAVKTNGELWVCGNNNEGFLGVNQAPGVVSIYSSPVQIPGTNWNTVLTRSGYWSMGGKTDGTLWTWGGGMTAKAGRNGADAPGLSSPTQVPGTDWVTDARGYYGTAGTIAAIKTDGSLWAWGSGGSGLTAQNDEVTRSSPIQVGTDTNWSKIGGAGYHFLATKTDGTLWTWGSNEYDHCGDGALGQNSTVSYSSPIQIGSHSMWTSDQISGRANASFVMLEDTSV